MNNSGQRKDVPNQGILYHYTSLPGLKGIVENGKIWATNILYLNDSEEFFNAMEAFNSVFDAMWDTPEEIDALNESEQKFLSSLEKRSKMFLKIPKMVLKFSSALFLKTLIN